MTGDRVLSAADKGIPARAVGRTVEQFLADGPTIDEFSMPLLVLHRPHLQHNIATLQSWVDRRGLELMPHGKTTMAPALWRRQIAAGATGLTLATPWQVRVARSHGFDTVQLANALVEPAAIRWAHSEVSSGLSLTTWVDSVAAVDALERVLGPQQVKMDVLVELGATGGRTGARSIGTAMEVAQRAARSGTVRLAGVAGYEGAVAHDRTADSRAAVGRYLGEMLELHVRLAPLYEVDRPIVTAGGSAYFDLVADAFAPARGTMPQTRFVLRSGAYITHDEGFYAGISPLASSRAGAGEDRLIAAARGLARVLSRPEPGLALLDAGKRDLPYDEGLPVPLGCDGRVTALNDQHTFLRSDHPLPLSVGDVVPLGLSHPCTMFDKWRLLPVVDSWDLDAPVVELIDTYF